MKIAIFGTRGIPNHYKNQSYVFDYIDPPSVMEKKIEPNRALICLLSFLIGFVISTLIVFAKHYHKEKKT